MCVCLYKEGRELYASSHDRHDEEGRDKIKLDIFNFLYTHTHMLYDDVVQVKVCYYYFDILCSFANDYYM